ncbi:MAG: C40 family peptidase [Bacteroidales bacterium]|nr:C40 family peptidase [Bacteroidales bacterium]
MKKIFKITLFVLVFLPLKSFSNTYSSDTLTVFEQLEKSILEDLRFLKPDIRIENELLYDEDELNSNAFYETLLESANSYLGTPYRSGGKTPKGFDCSGFTSFIFSRFGIKLNESSRSQILNGRKIEKKDIQKGDLIFFKGRNSKAKSIGHVGIVSDTTTSDISFIHSAVKGGVIVSKMSEPYYAARYVAAVRVEPLIFRN